MGIVEKVRSLLDNFDTTDYGGTMYSPDQGDRGWVTQYYNAGLTDLNNSEEMARSECYMILSPALHLNIIYQRRKTRYILNRWSACAILFNMYLQVGYRVSPWSFEGKTGSVSGSAARTYLEVWASWCRFWCAEIRRCPSCIDRISICWEGRQFYNMYRFQLKDTSSPHS